MPKIIEKKYTITSFNSDDTKVYISNNNTGVSYLYDFVLKTKTDINVSGLKVFSSAFSDDNIYIAVLLYNGHSSNLEEILVIECDSGIVVKKICLKDYIKKVFSVVTKIQFINNMIVASFQYSDASGAIVINIDLKKNFLVQTRTFNNTVIHCLQCIKDNVLLLCTKDNSNYLYLLNSNNLQKQDEISFKKGVIYSSNMFICSDKIYLVALINCLFKLHPKSRNYIMSDVDIVSDSIKLNICSLIKERKLPIPEQFLFGKGYLLGTKTTRYCSKKRVLGVYSIDSLESVGEFMHSNQNIYFLNMLKKVDMLSVSAIEFSQGEIFYGFFLSPTGKYLHLTTNKNTYILDTPKSFLELLDKHNQMLV